MDQASVVLVLTSAFYPTSGIRRFDDRRVQGVGGVALGLLGCHGVFGTALRMRASVVAGSTTRVADRHG
jgi:hypothetical protein